MNVYAMRSAQMYYRGYKSEVTLKITFYIRSYVSLFSENILNLFDFIDSLSFT